MRRLTAVAAATAVLLVLMAGLAQAKPITLTFHEKNATDHFVDVLPCIGGGVQAHITITYNAVFHVTAAGIHDDNFIPPYHVTSTTTGTFVADPIPAGLATYRGHFTQWFGENSNRQNFTATFTFTIVGSAADGSTVKFHETAHFSVTPTGVTLEFDKATCH
jgi:hypothetical protein